MDAFVGVIVGGAIATLGVFVTGWMALRAEKIRAETAAELDRERRKDDRRIDSDDFQRSTLLALQEAVRDYMNARTMLYLAGLLPPSREREDHMSSANAARTAADLAIDLHAQRVLDNELRESIRSMLIGDAMAAAHRLTKPEHPDTSIEAERERHRVVTEQLGEVLRRFLG